MPAPPAAGSGAPADRPRTSAWLRLGLLAVLLAAAVAAVAVAEPQRLFSAGSSWPGGPTGVLWFAVLYAACAAAWVPRPVLGLAAGVLFGAVGGTAVGLLGTLLSAALSFAAARHLGQEALRRLLRGRPILAGDRLLSERGFRSLLLLRLVPVLPFTGITYCAAVSRMPWHVFLGATALGCLPGVAAHAVAGATAGEPASPGFVLAAGFLLASGLAAGWAARRRSRRTGPQPGPRSGATAGPGPPPARVP